MKRQISTGLTFAPISHQVTLPAGIAFGQVLAILNVTSGNKAIYAMSGGSALGATASGSPLVLTLAADLAGMASGDTLILLYDDGVTSAQDGVDITGAGTTMPAGGSGIRGWLSAIYTKLLGTVAVSVAALPLPAGASTNRDSLLERLAREGEQLALYGSGSISGLTPGSGVNSTVTSTAVFPTVGKIVWVESISVSMTTSSPNNASALLQINIGAPSLFAGIYTNFFLQSGGNIVIPVRQFLRSATINSGTISVSIRQLNADGSASTSTVVYVGVNSIVTKVTDDLNLTAPKTILVAGDSTTNGTGPTVTANMYPFRFKQFLQLKGIDTRIVLKSVSGSTTSNHETWRLAGFYDVARIDFILYDLGINDAGAGVAVGDVSTSGTYLYNLNKFVTAMSSRWPGVKIVVLGVKPLENNTSETQAALYRTAASTYVAGLANANIKYTNLGVAFDRTAGLTFYVSSDTAGQRVHPNDSGHAALEAVLESAWPGYGWTSL